MNALKLATENLDTFERKLLEGLYDRAGIVVPDIAVQRIADRIPRAIDAPGPTEPLIQTKNSLQDALLGQGFAVDDYRCAMVAEALLPYISVVDSNLE